MFRTDEIKEDEEKRAAAHKAMLADLNFRRAVNEEARRQMAEKKKKERADGAAYIKNLEEELKEKEAHLYESEVM